MSYINVIDEAIEKFIKDYTSDVYKPITESDIHGYIFAQCLIGCSNYNLRNEIHLDNKHTILGRKKKIDILLNDEVAMEIKFEADYPGVSKPIVFKEEVNKDLERISYLRENGIKKAIFLFLDEDGEHYRNTVKRYGIPQSDWLVIDKKGTKNYLLIR